MSRILVVDDHKMITKAIVRGFRERGLMDIATAEGVEEAKRVFAEDSDIVVVLSDVMMDDGRGDQLHAAICKDLATRGGVFIAMTGNCPSSVERYFEQENVDVYGKPFNGGLLQLIDVIKDLVSK